MHEELYVNRKWDNTGKYATLRILCKVENNGFYPNRERKMALKIRLKIIENLYNFIHCKIDKWLDV